MNDTPLPSKWESVQGQNIVPQSTSSFDAHTRDVIAIKRYNRKRCRQWTIVYCV